MTTLLRALATCVLVLATAMSGMFAQDPVPTTPTSQSNVIRLLYIRVNFPDDPREPTSYTTAHAISEDVAAWYAESSYGLMQIATTVTEVLTMPRPWRYYPELTPMDLNDPQIGPPALHGDAIAAAAAAGYDTNAAIITVRHRGIWGWGGLGGGGKTWLQTDSVPVQCHEIGHAIGLKHADRWDNTAASGSPTDKDLDRITVVNANATGANGYAYEQEVVAYGDIWDNMGSGGLGHFNPIYKSYLGWLTGDRITTVTQSGRYKVFSYNQPYLEDARTYALKIRRNHQQTYWAGLRGWMPTMIFPQQPNERFLHSSLLLWMEGWDSQREQKVPKPVVSCLLDTTPGTPAFTSGLDEDGKVVDGGSLADAGIEVNRTYSDLAAGIHITVTDRNETTPQSLDVVVNLGTFPGNHAPEVSDMTVVIPAVTSDPQVVKAGAIQVAYNGTDPFTKDVTFSVTGTDADGDELAYWWDFGDSTPNSVRNGSTITHKWAQANIPRLFPTSTTDLRRGCQFTVTCVVTDMKGGTARISKVINIGQPAYPGIDANDVNGRQTFIATGRITDQQGNPMTGVLVTRVGGADFRGVWTDSDGMYRLSGLVSGNIVIQPKLEGWHFIGKDTAKPLPSPISIPNHDIQDVNFIAHHRQWVKVEALNPTVTEGGSPGIIRITRTGPTPHNDTDYVLNSWNDTTDLVVRIYTQGSFVELDRWDRRTRPAPDNRYYYILNPTPAAPRNLNGEVPGGATADGPIVEPDYPLISRGGDSPNSTLTGCGVSADQYVIIRRQGTFLAHASNDSVTTTFTKDYVDLQYTPPTSDGIWHPSSLAKVMVAYSPDYYVENTEASITIVDSSVMPTLPTVSVSVLSASENGSNQGAFIFTRIGDVSESLQVGFTISGTASEGVDYQALPRSIIFPVGIASVTLDVHPIADGILEGRTFDAEDNVWREQYIRLFLTANPSLYNGSGYVKLEIGDDDRPSIAVALTQGPALEPVGTGGARSGTFTIIRHGDLSSNLTVNFGFSGTATYQTDYVSNPALDGGIGGNGKVIIPAGRVSATVTVTPVKDSTVEGPEFVRLLIRDSTTYQILSTGSQADLSILDGDLPLVSVALAPGARSSIAKATQEKTTVRFSRNSSQNVTSPLFIYFTTSGQAQNGLDYGFTRNVPTAGQVLLLANETFKDVEVSASNDNNTNKDDKELYIFLKEDPTYTIDPNLAHADLIVNSMRNGKPEVRFEKLGGRFWESGEYQAWVVLSDWPTGTNTVDTNLVPPHKNLIRIDYEVVADDRTGIPNKNAAVPGTDFEVKSGTLTFWYKQDSTYTDAYVDPVITPNNPPGDYSVGEHDLRMRRWPVTFTINNDNLDTRDRTFLIRLKPHLVGGNDYSNCSLPGQLNGEAFASVFVVTIADDDAAAYTLEGTTLNASEVLSGPTVDGKVTIKRTGLTLAPSTVSLSLKGQAAPWADYTPVSTPTVVPVAPANTADRETIVMVTFAQDETEKVITIKPIRNLIATGPREATIALISATDGKVNTAARTITIADIDTQPPVFVSATAVNAVAKEGGHKATVRISRVGDLTSALTVNLKAGLLGTAVPADYSGMPGSAVIPANSDYVEFDITANDDLVVNGTRTLDVAINADGSTYQTGEPSLARIYILDNDGAPPMVRVWADPANVSETEPLSGAKFHFRRSMDIVDSLTVSYTLSGTAVNGTDYQLINASQVTFASGQAEAIVEILPIADTSAEGVETVTIEIAAGTGYTVGTTQTAATINIIDDDFPTLAIAPQVTEVIEGSASSAVFRISRLGGNPTIPLTATVQVATSSTLLNLATLTDLADATPNPITVTLAANEMYKDLSLLTKADGLAEGDEELRLVIASNPAFARLSTDPSDPVIIRDIDRSRITVRVDPANRNATQNVYPAASTAGKFLIERTGSAAELAKDVRVRFALTGSAVEGVDYQYVGTSVLIPANQASVSVSILPLVNQLVKPVQNVVLTLTPDRTGTNYNLGAVKSARMDVIDLNPVLVTIASPADYMFKGETTSFVVTRIGTTEGPLRVNYKIKNTSTAVMGTDFDLLIGYVDIADGSATTTINVKQNTDVIAARTLTLYVDTPTLAGTYVPGNPVEATVTMLPPGQMLVNIVANNDAKEKNLVQGKFTVTRSGGSIANPLAVSLSVSGTATWPDDYTLMVDGAAITPNSGILDFYIGAGKRTAIVNVLPIADSNPTEGDETVVLTLRNTNPVGYLINKPVAATVLIIDDAPAAPVFVNTVGPQIAMAGYVNSRITLTINDNDSLLSSLTLSASSADPDILPNSAFAFGGTDGNRWMTIQPPVDTSDTTIVTVRVSDGVLSSTMSFPVMMAVNVDPVVSPDTFPDHEVLINGTDVIAFKANDPDALPKPLSVTVLSSDLTLLPANRITVANNGGDYTVSLSPAPTRFGAVTVTILVDDGVVQITKSFMLSVVSSLGASIGQVTIAKEVDAAQKLLVPGSFLITRSVWTSNTITVNATIGGTAVGGTDYASLGGFGQITVTMTPGQSTAKIYVNPLFNPLALTDKTVTLTIQPNPSAYTIGAASSATLTIAGNTPTAPTVASIASTPAVAGFATKPIAVTVNDVDTPPANLVVTATSSDQALLPNSAITVTGSGKNWQIVAAPTAGGNGTATVTVTVSDGALTTTTTFPVTIGANQAPVFTVANTAMDQDTTVTVPISSLVTDPDRLPGNLVLTATSSDTAIVANSGLSVTATSLTISPVPGAHGTTTINLTANDGAASVPASFVLTVNHVIPPPVNLPPSAASQILTTKSGVPLPFTLVATDPEGQPLIWSVIAGAQNGTLTGTGPSFTYTSNASFVGNETLTFGVSDGVNLTRPTVTITVSTDQTTKIEVTNGPGSTSGGCGLGGGLGLIGFAAMLAMAGSRRRRQ